MIEKCARVLGDVAFHPAKPFAFWRPTSIQLSALGKQVNVQNTAAGMSQKVPLVGRERLRAKNPFYRSIHIRKASNPAGIALRQLFN